MLCVAHRLHESFPRGERVRTLHGAEITCSLLGSVVGVNSNSVFSPSPSLPLSPFGIVHMERERERERGTSWDEGRQVKVCLSREDRGNGNERQSLTSSTRLVLVSLSFLSHSFPPKAAVSLLHPQTHARQPLIMNSLLEIAIGQKELWHTIAPETRVMPGLRLL